MKDAISNYAEASMNTRKMGNTTTVYDVSNRLFEVRISFLRNQGYFIKSTGCLFVNEGLLWWAILTRRSKGAKK